jgi:hypothetical protein
VTATYSQRASGTLHVHIGGLAPGTGFTQLKVEGMGELAGKVQVATESGFHPTSAEMFRIVNANPRSGEFGSVEETGGGIGGGLRYTTNYDPTGLTLLVQSAGTHTTTTTKLSGEGKSGESITVLEGTAVSDQATLSGANASTASGTVSYAVYTDNECTKLRESARTKTVNGGVAGASEAKTLAPGTYYWQASYSGDASNERSTSTCGTEVETVEKVTPPSKVELPQPTPENQVGTPFSLTATVTEAGTRQSGVPVTFTVTGANPQTGSSSTNPTGEATFTYTGSNAGTDHIAASFVDKAGKTVVSNEVTKTWTAAAGGSGGGGTGKTGVLPSKQTLPAPVLGKTVNVEVVSGAVFVKLPPGAHLSKAASQSSGFESLSKGAGFIPLSEARQIPVGSTLDTTEGVVRLTAATAKFGKVQFGEFGAGIFTILQNRKQRGLTNLDILNTQSPHQVCTTIGKKAQVARRHLSRRVVGLLKGTAHGKFTTTGQYSAATVRGTIWSVANRCDGTLTQVNRGVVSVRDFLRRKTITLRAGQRYLAKAP